MNELTGVVVGEKKRLQLFIFLALLCVVLSELAAYPNVR